MILNDNDLPILKHLLKELRKTDSVYPESVLEFFDKKTYQYEFKRLGGILNKLNLCDFNKTKLGEIVLLPNLNTFDFEFDQYIRENREQEYRDNLELELAKSNIEANELNKKIAKQNNKNRRNNQIATWINIGIGFVNVCLIIWEIMNNK